jgi:hypothetical protein
VYFFRDAGERPKVGARVSASGSEYSDGSFTGVACQEGWSFRAFRECAPGGIELFAHVENRGAHIGSPCEACGGSGFTIAADASEFNESRGGCDGLFDGFSNEAGDFRCSRSRVECPYGEYGE